MWAVRDMISGDTVGVVACRRRAEAAAVAEQHEVVDAGTGALLWYVRPGGIGAHRFAPFDAEYRRLRTAPLVDEWTREVWLLLIEHD